MFPTHLDKSQKTILALVLILLLGGGLYLLLQHPSQPSDDPNSSLEIVSSFEECVAAGYPVMESYPRQCRSAEGTRFVEKVDGPIAESFGSIQGIILLGPVCPVMQDPPDPECNDKPYQTTLVLTSADGSRVIQQFTSKIDGTFALDVPAGNYAIRSTATANTFPRCSSTDVIHVPVNDTVVANVSCDTGIR